MASSSSTGNSQFLGTHEHDDDDDMAQLYYQIYSQKEGKSIDPRLIMLLEYFRELFDRKRELFRKIFPRSTDELVQFFKKIGEMVSQVKSDRRGVRSSMQRSLSLGSPRRTRDIKGGDDDLRPERFMVVRPAVVRGDDQGGDDDTSGGGQGGSQ
ncbi:hypothetical protein ACOSP7_032996 [Xanthoceras sorbifolium]